MKKPIILAAAALLIIYGTGCSAFWNGKMSEAAVREGGEAYRRSNYAAAARHFTNGIALDPDNAKAYIGRGEAYARLGRNKEAAEDIRKFLKYAPYDKAARKLLSDIGASNR